MQKIYTTLLLTTCLFGSVYKACLAQTPITQSGNGSYYNDKYIGARTANGEKYDAKDFTAAHLTFPYGSLVKISSPTTQKSVVVRINDRLSPQSPLAINLSMAAAKIIGLDKRGRDVVEIELVKNFPLGEWREQATAYSTATQRADNGSTETGDTTITEDTLQFRAEFFNLSNTPTFFLPSASSNNMTCIGPAGAACNAGNPNFGKLSNGTATGRQIQFGLKLLF